MKLNSTLYKSRYHNDDINCQEAELLATFVSRTFGQTGSRSRALKQNLLKNCHYITYCHAPKMRHLFYPSPLMLWVLKH
jgi:hypothetical protein